MKMIRKLRLCVGVVVLLLANSAVGSISLPDCDLLERLAAGIDAEQKSPINRWSSVGRRDSGVIMTSGVVTPEFAQAFGKPLLSWQRQDMQALNPKLHSCMKGAQKQKRLDAQRALGEMRRVLQYHINATLRTVERARSETAKHMPALQNLSVSVDHLQILTLLDRLGQSDRQQATSEVRAPIERMRADGVTPARLVAGEIVNLPEAEAQDYLQKISQSRRVMVSAVLADLQQSLRNVDVGVVGLSSIHRTEQQLADTLGELLPSTEVAALRQAAGQARQAVWSEWQAQLATDAAAVTSIQAVMRQAEYRSLPAQDQNRLQQLLASAQQQAAQDLVAGTADELQQFEQTLEGLKAMVGYAEDKRRALARQYNPQARQAFENAFHDAHQAGLAEVQEEFVDYLDELPESADSVRAIRQLLSDIQAPARSALYVSGLQRARQIGSAVERAQRQQQCAAVLPDLDLDADDAEQLVIGPGTQQILLGDMLCDIALAGSTVHSYEPPGFFSDDHVLELTARDGLFYTYTLQAVKAGPDTQALMGVAVAGPSSEQALDAAAWKNTLAKLLPGQAGAGNDRCAQLMNKPEAELSANDRMAAVGCVMNSLLGN